LQTKEYIPLNDTPEPLKSTDSWILYCNQDTHLKMLKLDMLINY